MWIFGSAPHGNYSGNQMFYIYHCVVALSCFGIISSCVNGEWSVAVMQERLEREYNLSLITTAPSVVYRVNCSDGEMVIALWTSFFDWIYEVCRIALCFKTFVKFLVCCYSYCHAIQCIGCIFIFSFDILFFNAFEWHLTK